MAVNLKLYRFIWDFNEGKIQFGYQSKPMGMSALKKYYEDKGYFVITEGKKLYIKRG